MLFLSLLTILLFSGSFNAYAQESVSTPDTEQTQQDETSAPDPQFVKNLKIKVLLNLHRSDKAKALQYASALALQLQESTDAIDQELYSILCRYISLALHNQSNLHDDTIHVAVSAE